MRTKLLAAGVFGGGILAAAAALALHGAAGARASVDASSAQGVPADAVVLPESAIVYSDTAPGPSAGSGPSRALFRRAGDGGRPMRLTFDGQDAAHPAVLHDGRILFERRLRYPDPSRPPVWMTIHPDGTQPAAYGDGARPENLPLAADGSAPPILTSVVAPDRRTGTLLCLDSYLSRHAAISRLPRGVIRKVIVSRAGGPDGEILAEAAVASDGSFFVEVPADTPLSLRLLDAEGRALGSLASGIWVRPGENRGCIGCHEEPDVAPENRFPLALTMKEGRHAP